MKWLITGANGQLGRCLQKTLDSQRIEFVALSRADLDITNIGQVEQLIKSVDPDVVINAAAYTNVEQAETDSDEAFKINQLGAANLAIASRSVNAKLLHFTLGAPCFKDYFDSPMAEEWHRERLIMNSCKE
jgi:dTDP-4-dehydrorhamnose reductase